jgi:hypothetical protein
MAKLIAAQSEQDALAKVFADALVTLTSAAAGLHENRKRLAQLGVEIPEDVLLALLGREAARYLPLQLMTLSAEHEPRAPSLRSTLAAMGAEVRRTLQIRHEKEQQQHRAAIDAAAEALLKQYRRDNPQSITAE